MGSFCRPCWDSLVNVGSSVCARAHARTNVGGYVCLNNVHPACSWEASAPRIFRLVTELSSLIAKSIELAAAELNRPELLRKRPHLGSTLMVAMASKVASAVGLTASVANILLSGWPKGGRCSH